MGLFSTTYVVNRTTTENFGALSKATKDLANATEAVAKSNQNIANSINSKRIKITHHRYAELQNKSLLLSSIISWLDNYVSIVFNLIKEKEFSDWYNDKSQFFDRYPLQIEKNNIKLIVDTNKEEINVFFRDELLPFTYHDNVPDTDGEVNLNENDYNKHLRDEVYLEKYFKLMENIESYMYIMVLNKYYGILGANKGTPMSYRLAIWRVDSINRCCSSSAIFDDKLMLDPIKGQYKFHLNNGSLRLRIIR